MDQQPVRDEHQKIDFSALDEFDGHVLFNDTELAALQEVSAELHCEPGDAVFRIGETGDCMYVVVSGEFELRFGEGKEPKRIGEGAVFGELAFVMGEHRRTATVVATRPGEVAVFGHAAFDALLQDHPRLLVLLLRRTCSYLLGSEQGLIGHLKEKNRKLEHTLEFLRRTREELDYQELLAQTDALTGLYNRRCLDEQLPKFVRRGDESRDNLALIMLDLDGFKPINDTYGHAAGDQVLVQVADLLRASIRRTDLPCRLGGDEFAMLMPDVTREQALERAEDLRRGIEELQPVGAEAGGLRVSGSVGGTLLRRGESAERFLERSDQAMYAAKGEGRNRVIWVD